MIRIVAMMLVLTACSVAGLGGGTKSKDKPDAAAPAPAPATPAPGPTTGDPDTGIAEAVPISLVDLDEVRSRALGPLRFRAGAPAAQNADPLIAVADAHIAAAFERTERVVRMFARLLRPDGVMRTKAPKVAPGEVVVAALMGEDFSFARFLRAESGEMPYRVDLADAAGGIVAQMEFGASAATPRFRVRALVAGGSPGELRFAEVDVTGDTALIRIADSAGARARRAFRVQSDPARYRTTIAGLATSEGEPAFTLRGHWRETGVADEINGSLLSATVDEAANQRSYTTPPSPAIVQAVTSIPALPAATLDSSTLRLEGTSLSDTERANATALTGANLGRFVGPCERSTTKPGPIRIDVYGEHGFIDRHAEHLAALSAGQFGTLRKTVDVDRVDLPFTPTDLDQDCTLYGTSNGYLGTSLRIRFQLRPAQSGDYTFRVVADDVAQFTVGKSVMTQGCCRHRALVANLVQGEAVDVELRYGNNASPNPNAAALSLYVEQPDGMTAGLLGTTSDVVLSPTTTSP